MRARQVADNRGLDVETTLHAGVSQPLATNEHRAVAPCFGDGRLMPVDGPLVDDRSHPVRAEERVADRDCLGLLHEPTHELVVDRALDVDPRVGRALLATEAEGAAHDPLGRLVEVRLARHDRGVLATHLDDAWPRPGRGERVKQPHPHVVRTGKHDSVHALVILKGLADGLARAHHQIDGPRGHTGIDIRLDQLHRRQRRDARRLQDDGVPCQ